jgi:hypothetical protein
MKAGTDLTRRSHQNRAGETSDEDAQTNTERFIAAHIIPVRPRLDPNILNLVVV